jgi:hypothetical protein
MGVCNQAMRIVRREIEESVRLERLPAANYSIACNPDITMRFK